MSYICQYCGRVMKYPVAHKCRDGFRKRKLKFKTIMTYDEQIEVIQAAKEGKTIQFKPKVDNHAEWQDDSPLSQFDFNTNYYRVKPENKYRPFKSADEAFQEAKKHGFWVKYGNYSYSTITVIDGDNSKDVEFKVSCDGESILDADFMLEIFCWADDGSKVGILENNE